ncbi:MAG: hypothetical protein NTY19_16905 [Planctomycetota bacterium]|nr:hypothetical protein [Planctomycetota bacterium]
MTLGGIAANGAEAAQKTTIADKTLVAWVAPANLTQRGGSVLTLEDPHGCFDGIVFGELSPGRWMAGSDNFHRTQRNQAHYPTETADPQTLLQMPHPPSCCPRSACPRPQGLRSHPSDDCGEHGR